MARELTSSPFPPDRQAPTTAGAPENRIAFPVRNAVIGFAGLLGVVMLIRLILLRSFNYDELSHAHMTWLVSVGEVPYRDFAANHFPFLWILLSPLMRVLPESLATLIVLRGLALVCNAVFVTALGVLIAAELRPPARLWAAVCLGLVVFNPYVTQYLIEFRPDALANALLFSALALLRFRGWNNRKAAFVGGLLIGMAVLVNTKYLLFPFILGGVALIMAARRIRLVWLCVLAICLGFGAALLGSLLLLGWMRIPLADMWRMVVTYNGAVGKALPFGFGLVKVVTQFHWLLAWFFAGLIGCIVLYHRQRRPPESLAIAAGIFLAVNLVTTARPWKQYVVAWLLLAAYFPARSLPLLVARLRPGAQAVAAGCVLITAAVGLARMGTIDPGMGGQDRASQDRAINWLLKHVHPDEFVVTSFDLHPVFRRDTFFKTVFDITERGDGLEEFMPQLAPGPYSEHFQESGYEKELELRPPAAVLVGVGYTRQQGEALNAYLERHRNSYDARQIPGTQIVVLERITGSSPPAK